MTIKDLQLPKDVEQLMCRIPKEFKTYFQVIYPTGSIFNYLINAAIAQIRHDLLGLGITQHAPENKQHIQTYARRKFPAAFIRNATTPTPVESTGQAE